jgi:hypothetical protein
LNNYYIVIGVVVALCLYIIIMFFMNQQAPLNKTPTIDDKRIDEHNQNFPWKQGPNKFFEGSTLADAKKIMNTSFASHSNLIRCNVDDSIVPPESFDSRKEWPNCVSPVGNQQSNLIFYNKQIQHFINFVNAFFKKNQILSVAKL